MANRHNIPERRRYKRFKVKKELSDRRKHKRYTLRESTYAVLKPNQTRMGQLVDINEKGLTLHYFDIGACSRNIYESSELSLFLNEGILFLEDIPIKVVSEEIKPDRFSDDATAMKRLFVRFGVLTQEQEMRLDDFLLNRTKDVLQDRRS